MNIIKATDPIVVEHPVFLIFGQPGIGKSSLGYSMLDCLTLDYDKGAHRAANRRDTLAINTQADVAELMKADAVLAKYASFSVDTVGRALDVMTAEIAKNPKLARSGGDLNQQGWGALKTHFRQWMAALRALGKNVLLIAHDKEDKDGDTRIVRPDIVGGSYGEVLKNADFVGYLSMVGRERILDFNPTDRWVGKNPAGWEPFKVPSVGKAAEFMAELYAKGAEALGKISEASARVADNVEAWRTKIATFTTAEECNKAIPDVKKLSAIEAPQVSKLLLDHARAKGIKFDNEKRQFFAPATAGSPQSETDLFVNALG